MKPVNLKEVTSVIMGQSPPSKTYTQNPQDMAFFQGKAEFSKKHPLPRKYCSTPIRVAERGDILISVRAPVGSVNLANQRCCIGRGLAAIRPSDKILSEYVFYYLRHIEKRIENMGEGSTFKAINRKAIEQIKIIVPPLETQKKIVAILERAERLKEKRAQTNQDTQDIIQSLFYEMFGDPLRNEKGWETKRIKQVIQKTEKTDPATEWGDKEFQYIDISSINRVTKQIGQVQHIKGNDAPSRARQIVKTGDLLISTVRPNLNSVALVPERLNEQICSTGYCILRSSAEVKPEYLFEISKMGKFISLLMNKAKGASYPAVSNKDIQEIEIAVPPIKTQEEFLSIAMSISYIQQKQVDGMYAIDNLFQTLMDKSFKGEIVL